MIENLNESIKKIVLGEGTTYIGQVLVDKSTMSSGIVFSNHPFDSTVHEGDVIIEIKNIKGVLSLLRSIIDLLNTWKIEGTEKQIDALIAVLNDVLKEGE